LPTGERDPSLAPDDGRTGWHFSFFTLPNLPELLLTGRERPFWTYFARRQMWDPSALADDDIDEMVRSVEQPGGTRAILEIHRAREVDAEQNRPHHANPIGCPVLAVGGQAYLGDAVARQLAQVARDVRGAVITASGHNVALENPAALAQAYLKFFASTGTRAGSSARPPWPPPLLPLRARLASRARTNEGLVACSMTMRVSSQREAIASLRKA